MSFLAFLITTCYVPAPYGYVFAFLHFWLIVIFIVINKNEKNKLQ